MVREINYYKYFDGQGTSKIRGYKFERYGTTFVELRTITLKGGERKVVLANEEEGIIKNSFTPKVKDVLLPITEQEYNSLDISNEKKESATYRERVDRGIEANLQSFFHQRAALTGKERLEEYSKSKNVAVANEAETKAFKEFANRAK